VAKVILIKRIPILFLLTISLFCALGSAFAAQSLLGIGDVVKVTVYGHQDLNTVARVSYDGKVTFPLIGQVAVAGLSIREAESKIARLLSKDGFVRDPQVQLFVEQRHQARGDLVTILGQVKHPGRFPVQSLAEDGAESIVDLLALTGGTTERAADYLILSKKEGGKNRKIRIDLVALMRRSDMSQNYSLSGGDIVIVPRMEVFYIYGGVQRPGRQRLEHDMTVIQALSLGGGLTSRASDKGVTIKRRGKSGKVETISVGLSDGLQADDVIYVKESLF